MAKTPPSQCRRQRSKIPRAATKTQRSQIKIFLKKRKPQSLFHFHKLPAFPVMGKTLDFRLWGLMFPNFYHSLLMWLWANPLIHMPQVPHQNMENKQCWSTYFTAWGDASGRGTPPCSTRSQPHSTLPVILSITPFINSLFKVNLTSWCIPRFQLLSFSLQKLCLLPGMSSFWLSPPLPVSKSWVPVTAQLTWQLL